MNCPVCGAYAKERCSMTEPPFPSECLRLVKPPLLCLEPLGVGMQSSNIKDAWEGPGVEALAGVVDQIRKPQGRAA